MMGNFTSLLAKDTLNTNYQTISSYPSLISSSVYSDGGMTPVYTTSLTPTQVTTITNNLQTIVNLMYSRRTGDVAFYNNCQNIASDYNTLKQFSAPGMTESYLLQNYVGSAKLLSRLNS
jgi:hypothetical protein